MLRIELPLQQLRSGLEKLYAKLSTAGNGGGTLFMISALRGFPEPQPEPTTETSAMTSR
jgi:hypothetical protein